MEEEVPAIEVIVPAEPEFMRLVRLLASGIGSLAGFDIEDIEDFRIGVDEACTLVLSVCDGSGLKLTFEIHDESVDVVGTTTGAVVANGTVGGEPVQQSLSDRILGVVVDRHEVRLGPEEASFELHKRR